MKGSSGTGASGISKHASSATGQSQNTGSGKHGSSTNAVPAKATAEQIRQAKLSQLPGHDDRSFQSVISEVAEVTGKPAEMVSVALHDCNYDANAAIQNLLDGLYDSVEFEWKTTSTKKKRVGNALVDEQAPDAGRSQNDALDEFDIKPANRTNKSMRGKQGRGGKRNVPLDGDISNARGHGDDSFQSRGRGRGRNGARGDSGSRRGLPRGRGGATRARGRSNRGRVGGGRGRGGSDYNASKEQTDANEPFKFSDDECWDTEEINTQAPSVTTNNISGWCDEAEEDKSNNELSWGQDVGSSAMNGTSWGDEVTEVNATTEPVERNEVSTSATPTPVGFSVSTSSSTSIFESNQFPSASEDADTRHFDMATFAGKGQGQLPPPEMETETAHMISGIHESHMLEADLLTPKVKSQKAKKAKPKFCEPVQMPQGLYEDVADVSHQLDGLEFGGSSLSPVLPKHESPTSIGQLSSLPVTQSPPSTSLETYRHSVAPDPVASFNSVPLSVESLVISSNEKPKTPPGLGSLQDKPLSRYASSPSRHVHRLGKTPNPIPFPKQEKSAAPGLVSIPSAVSVAPYKSSMANNRKVTDSVGNGLSTEYNQSALHHINISDSASLPAQYAASSLVSPGSSVSRNQGGTLSTQSTTSLSEDSLPNGPPSTLTSHGSSSSKQFTGSGNKHNPTPGVLPLNMYPNVQQGMVPAYQHQAMASPMPFDDMSLHGIPLSPYYDMMYVPQNPSQTSGSSRNDTSFSGDGKYARDSTAAPAVSSMSQVNQHTGPHHVQQPAYLNAANAHMPYQYYYPPGVIQSGFPVFTTAPVYQVGTGKGHVVGPQYQSGFSSQHSSHSYNSGGHDYGNKGFSYTSSVTQSSQSGKSSQSSGVGGGSTSTESSLSGYKAGFGQDMKAYVAASPVPTMGIPMPHGPTPMGNYAPTPYLMQPSMIHPASNHVGHPSLDNSAMQSSRSQGHHHHHTVGSGSASHKRENKSYWSGSS